MIKFRESASHSTCWHPNTYLHDVWIVAVVGADGRWGWSCCMKVAGRVTHAEKSEPRGRQHGHYRPESKFPSSYPHWPCDPGLRHSVPPSVKRRQPLCPDGAEWGWLEPRDQDVRALRHLWDASSSVTTRSLRVAHGHHPVAPSAWTPAGFL